LQNATHRLAFLLSKEIPEKIERNPSTNAPVENYFLKKLLARR
jgi:hypothetical protein